MKELLRRFAAWSGFFRCPVCMKNSGNGQNEICPDCLQELPLLPVADRCSGCGGENKSALAVCPACMQFAKRPYTDALALMKYTGTGCLLIQQLKSGSRPELARPLGVLAAQKLAESGMTFDVIVPVPLHWKRYLLRSYNQSEVIGSMIASETGKPLIRGLKKVTHTPHQRRLKKEARLKNLQNSFAVRDDRFKGKTVLLIDDVLTTGTTVSAAAKVLLDNGAANVKVLCCARTPSRI